MQNLTINHHPTSFSGVGWYFGSKYKYFYLLVFSLTIQHCSVILFPPKQLQFMNCPHPHHALVNTIQRDYTQARASLQHLIVRSEDSTFTFTRGKITYSFQFESSAAKAYKGRVWILNIRQFLQRKPGIQCCGYNSLSLT